jgi:predicted GIY-YIG superfamily endonuclease
LFSDIKPSITCIYRINNTVNNKNYIGSTIDFKQRLIKHKTELENSCHHCKHLENAYKKYTEDKFRIYVEEFFEEITLEELHVHEAECILKYNSDNAEYGYNLMKPGEFPKISTEGLLKQQKNRDDHKLKVMAFDKNTGEKRYEFDSVSEAAEFCGTSTSNVSRVCSGKLNSIKGYVFIYKSNYDSNKCYKYIKPDVVISEETKNSIREGLSKSKKMYVYDKSGI